MDIRRDPPAFLRKVMASHGSLAAMRMGPHRVIMAGHPDAVKHVCVTNAANYEKTRFVEKLKPILGEGLATSNGSIWQASRPIIQPKLNAAQVTAHIARMDEIIRADVASWPHQPFDIAKASCAMTLKVISGTMFGNPNNEAALRVVTAIDAIQDYLSKNVWAVVPVHQWLPTRTRRRFRNALRDIDTLLRQMMTDRKAGTARSDLLQALIEAVDPVTGRPFSDQQVRDEVMTMFMAGHDTTGNTLSFIWDVLASDPALQARLRDEVMAAIPLDRPPTPDDLKKLELTLSVIKETMRLNPASWWFARTAIADDTIMDMPVQAGDVVMVAPYVTHRLEEFWPNASTFDPARFLKGVPAERFAYIPLGAGPRMCPGGHFAHTEMLIAVARLLQRAELQKQQTLEHEALITLRPKGGLRMTVKPLSRLYTISGVTAGEHAFVDTLLRLRKQVFVDELGWNLSVDGDGREIDQFDTAAAEHTAIIADGEVKAFGRLLPTDQASILFDVYPHLVAKESGFLRGPDVWEGTRMATPGYVPVGQKAHWLRHLVLESADRKYREGVRSFCSVSDPVLERILKRTGIQLRRLGDVFTDANGHKMLALELDCKVTGLREANDDLAVDAGHKITATA
jgi:cytochrome P450/N-acyl-L-homoserine lactone synthetase